MGNAGCLLAAVTHKFVAHPTGTVFLDGPAPTNFTVTLTNSNTNAALKPSPFTVEVPVTRNSRDFDINTRPVVSDTTVTIAANPTVSGSFTVRAPRIQSLSLSAAHVLAGTSVTGTVTLDSPAPSNLPSSGNTGGVAGGLVPQPAIPDLFINGVNLNSSNTAAATVPSPATIPAGGRSANFNVTTGSVTSAQCTAIIARFNNSKSVFLGVSPSQSSDLSFSLPSTNITAVGETLTGTVTIGGTFPQAAALSSSNPGVATVSPASVTMVAGIGGTNQITIRGVSEGCTMITATKTGIGGSTRRSIMVVVGIPAFGKSLFPRPDFFTRDEIQNRPTSGFVASSLSRELLWHRFTREPIAEF